MSRLRFMPFVLLGVAAAQQQQQTPPVQQLPPDEDPVPAKVPAAQAKPPVAGDAKPVAGAATSDDLPPDEDATTPKEEYSFNPVKSKKAAAAGDFYFKKGNYKAALLRYREATGWNEGNTEAWLKLGEAAEKEGQKKAAVSAYQKYLQLAGNTKSAAEVKKKLEKLQ